MHGNGDVDIKKGSPTSKWRTLSFVLSVLCIALVVFIVVVYYMKEGTSRDKDPSVCHGLPSTGESVLGEPDTPSVFHDLTVSEILRLKEYLANNDKVNVTSITEQTLAEKSALLFDVDLHLPTKEDVLNYLGGKTVSKPERFARVTLYRQDLNPPVVQEYIVGPTSDPHHIDTYGRPVPYAYRPILPTEINIIKRKLAEVCSSIDSLLFKSFGGTTSNCGETCLVFAEKTIMGKLSSGVDETRKMWFWLAQSVGSSVLNPVDFAVLVDIKGQQPIIEKVWYNSFSYNSLTEFRKAYDTKGFVKLKLEFPNKADDHFSKILLRGPKTPSLPQRPPMQLEPDGRRYTVTHQEVTYMNWNFHFRMSSVHGPQLYDVKFLKKSMFYELGLQEILVQYSGNIPTHKFGNHFGTVEMMGRQAKGLVPGVDCPESALFIDVTMVTGSDPHRKANTFCIFEHNTNVPLRRHHSKDGYFEGASNSVLILRTILSLFQSEYVIDFIFYPTGTIEIKVSVSGLLLPVQLTDSNNLDDAYGFKIQQQIIGSTNRHFCNFKVDLDIGGTSNRLQILDIKAESVMNQFSKKPDERWFLERIESKTDLPMEDDVLRLTGSQEPIYQLFYSNIERTKENNPRAYRLVNNAILPNLTPDNEGIEPLAPWIKHPLIVTKRKETELQSSSKYSAFISGGTSNGFSSFYSDKDDIVDQDLVAWVTVGKHHIPHSEDLPVVHTPGMQFGFLLSPFNFFPENPAMGSRDSVRYERKASTGRNSWIKANRHSNTESIDCVPPYSTYENLLRKKPAILFGDS